MSVYAILLVCCIFSSLLLVAGVGKAAASVQAGRLGVTPVQPCLSSLQHLPSQAGNSCRSWTQVAGGVQAWAALWGRQVSGVCLVGNAGRTGAAGCPGTGKVQVVVIRVRVGARQPRFWGKRVRSCGALGKVRPTGRQGA